MSYTTTDNPAVQFDSFRYTNLALNEFQSSNKSFKSLKIEFEKETIINDIRFQLDKRPEPIEILKKIPKKSILYSHPVRNDTVTLCNVEDRLNLYQPATALVISEYTPSLVEKAADVLNEMNFVTLVDHRIIRKTENIEIEFKIDQARFGIKYYFKQLKSCSADVHGKDRYHISNTSLQFRYIIYHISD